MEGGETRGSERKKGGRKRGGGGESGEREGEGGGSERGGKGEEEIEERNEEGGWGRKGEKKREREKRRREREGRAGTGARGGGEKGGEEPHVRSRAAPGTFAGAVGDRELQDDAWLRAAAAAGPRPPPALPPRAGHVRALLLPRARMRFPVRGQRPPANPAPLPCCRRAGPAMRGLGLLRAAGRRGRGVVLQLPQARPDRFGGVSVDLAQLRGLERPRAALLRAWLQGKCGSASRRAAPLPAAGGLARAPPAPEPLPPPARPRARGGGARRLRLGARQPQGWHLLPCGTRGDLGSEIQSLGFGSASGF